MNVFEKTRISYYREYLNNIDDFYDNFPNKDPLKILIEAERLGIVNFGIYR